MAFQVFSSPCAHDVKALRAEARSYLRDNGEGFVCLNIQVTTDHGSEALHLFADEALAASFNRLAASINEIFAESAALLEAAE